ncbi:MAG: hypothetical protein KAJ18_10545 [Candidatus Omnitrophica bacterium]|nr:hypothetical protein [Candidatus Omnitrophota bacterium]
MNSQKKKILFVGLVMIVFAFVCVVYVFYVMINTQRDKTEQIEILKEELAVLSSEMDVAQRKTEDLEKTAGKSLRLESLLAEANKVYSNKEKSRRDGYLWVDREESTWIVTLGAIHGLAQGSSLAVYDGNDKAGSVVVKTLLDVISYVQPDKRSANKFTKDNYRVVVEE